MLLQCPLLNGQKETWKQNIYFLKRIKLNDQVNDNKLRKIPKFYLIPGVGIL